MSIDKANLLTNINSFHWENRQTDRAEMLDDLIRALEYASAHGDNLFSHPLNYDLRLSWGYYHEILYYTEDERNQFIPWLRDDHQIFLINIWGRPTTEVQSSNLEELDIAFPDLNNGLFGCATEHAGERCVYDYNSWRKLHQDFVHENLQLRETHREYFDEFYIPCLARPANKINAMIQKGQAHSIFKRIDPPTQLDENSTLHGEQIHIHFNDAGDSALNIDGSWKHGGFDIPMEARILLKEWGFLLPEDQS